jgi:hypothetical protein
VVLNKFKEKDFTMSKLIVSLTIVFLLTGCGHTTLSIFTDRETNAHIVQMNENRLSGGISYVALDAQRYEKEGQISYTFIIKYQGLSFINIDAGKSLVIIFDGQRNELAGRGSEKYRGIVSLGLVKETAYYHDIDPDLIRKLAYAKKIVVEVHGSTDALTRYFNEKNLSNLKEFYDHYVDTRTIHESSNRTYQ